MIVVIIAAIVFIIIAFYIFKGDKTVASVPPVAAKAAEISAISAAEAKAEKAAEKAVAKAAADESLALEIFKLQVQLEVATKATAAERKKYVELLAWVKTQYPDAVVIGDLLHPNAAQSSAAAKRKRPSAQPSSSEEEHKPTSFN